MERIEDQPTITYDLRSGEDIGVTAARMIALAKRTRGRVEAMFSGVVKLTATADSTVEGIVADFMIGMAAAAVASRESDEGQRAASEDEAQRVVRQQKVDTLMGQLPNLDFANQEAVLDWLCKFQRSSEYIKVMIRRDEVLAIFAQHGYEPGVNTGEAYNEEDRDNVARYIIGQALATLRNLGYIAEDIHAYTQDWKERFPS